MRRPLPTGEVKVPLQLNLTSDHHALAQLDLVGDLMRQADAAERENHFGRQLFVALETAGFHRVAHRLFDLALRGDADLLEKFAQAGVENVFVHGRLLFDFDPTPIKLRTNSHPSRPAGTRTFGDTGHAITRG